MYQTHDSWTVCVLYGNHDNPVDVVQLYKYENINNNYILNDNIT